MTNNNETDFEELLKIVIIGDSGVGKTNYVYRFVEGEFSPIHAPTVGFDFKSKICYLPNSQKKIKFQIWDTAGTEKYMSINKALFQRVQGIILMYDISDVKTFNHLEKWMELIRELASGIPLILIGNKIDLINDRLISKEKGEQFANDNNITFFESSGKSGINIEESFIYLGEEIIKNKSSNSKAFEGNTSIISKDSTKSEKKRSCC